MTITASAPAKLMLYGEHAVVYGAPCLVTAVDLRVQVSVTPRADDTVTIGTPALAAPFVTSVGGISGGAAVPRDVLFVVAALRAWWAQGDATARGCDIRTAADFSHSYGLGSSSAVTVAAIRALSAAAGDDLAPRDIFRLSYAAVLDAQRGVGSGYDVAAAAFGGTLYYVTPGDVAEPLPAVELPLVVGYSGVKADTATWVRRVAELADLHPALVRQAWQLIGGLVEEARAALCARDWPVAGRLMNINHGLLSALGVSAGPLETLVHAAREAGAHGAKLSGAGGGDCMIALAEGAGRTAVETALERSHVPAARVVRVRTGAEGARIEP